MRNLHTSRSSNLTSSNNKDHSTSSSPVPRMPYERSNPTAPSSRQQPQPPSLAKRTPVTPKLAAKTTSSQPSQRQTVTLAAPVPRKTNRPDSTISQNTASNLGANGTKRTSGGLRDAFASSASHPLQSNVTPRHDSRQSRTSSATTSPSPADIASVDAWETRSGLGIAAPVLEADASRRSVPTSTIRDSKFFYASDAPKGAQPPPASSRPPPTLPKGPTFFYANGTNLPPKSSPTLASPASFSPPLAAPTSDPLGGKFMYASGTPDLKPSPITSGTASVISTSSKRTSSKVGSVPQSPVFVAQRAPSPAKVTSHSTSTASAPGPSIAERRSVLSSTPQLNNTSLRRISTEAPPRKSSDHSRSGSLVAEPPSVTRTVATSPPVTSPLHSPLAFSTPQGLSMASVLQAAEEAADLVDHDDNESMVSGLTSPKSSKGDDPLNELVANARRERKVQDLQITNASLEAINRTLERQLRKQTNELRRYKRLSRAGRLSSANTVPPSRTVSDSAVSENPEGPLNELNLSDLSEEGEDDMDQEDEDLDESELSEPESSGSANMSPDTAAVKDEKYRKRDENRLQIDLSKHQQLLVDSQKMNQSLKRCLGWTEELIKEGKRALAYQVRVSEVDIGGRVAHEDGEKPFIYDGATLWDHSEEQDEHSLMDHDVLSEDDDEDDDADETMQLRIERLRPVEDADGNKSTQDRDSGIVLPGDGV